MTNVSKCKRELLFRHVTNGADSLDAEQIEKINEKIDQIETDLANEIKAQRMADMEGKMGWRMVKEYEGPDL